MSQTQVRLSIRMGSGFGIVGTKKLRGLQGPTGTD